jgi:ribosomal protein S17E
MEEIINHLVASFTDVFGEAEIMATSRKSVIIFKTFRDTFVGEFDNAANKDAVDEVENSLSRKLNNYYSSRRSELAGIANLHNLEGLPRIVNLYNSMAKDVEKLESVIGQTADRRKAQLDRDAATAAKVVYDAAVERVNTAGKAIAKNNGLRALAMKGRESATTDEEQQAFIDKINAYEADTKLQEVLKAEAEVEVTRLREAKDNSDKLATLAGEIADAKANTDAIVADLQDARDALDNAITQRADGWASIQDEINTQQLAANKETDEKLKTQKQA